MTDASDPLSRIRIVLVAPSHPGNIGATARAMHDDGACAARAGRAAPLSRSRSRSRSHRAPTSRPRRARASSATLDDALAGTALSIGLSARPREFAGRVLAVRDAAQRGDRDRGARRRRARLRQRDVGSLERRARALRARRDDPGQPGVRVAQPRGGGAGRVPTSCASLPRAAPCGARRHSRRPRQTRSRRCTRMPSGRSSRCAFSIRAMPKRLLPRLRRLFARAGLEKEEVNILRGILARIDQFVARRRDSPVSRRARDCSDGGGEWAMIAGPMRSPRVG